VGTQITCREAEQRFLLLFLEKEEYTTRGLVPWRTTVFAQSRTIKKKSSMAA
jgi:hypothetical protein